MRSLLLVLLALALAGCDEKWSVEYGTAQPFPGGSVGYRLASDGTVQRWRAERAGERPERRQLGRTSREALAELRAALSDPALARVTLPRTEGMTETLQWSVAGESGRLWWAPGTALPRPLARVVAAARVAIAATGEPQAVGRR